MLFRIQRNNPLVTTLCQQEFERIKNFGGGCWMLDTRSWIPAASIQYPESSIQDYNAI